MASGHELPGSFREALAIARRLLSASHELVRRDLVDAEAEILVMEAYRKVAGRALSRSEFYLRTADRYPEAAAAILLTWAGARAEGRLLQHLTGVQVFLNHEYEVGPDALVPRPETEVLVTVATEELGGGRSTPVRGLEIGLGSGAIAIELLSRFPGLRIRASELSEGAVALAVRNAEKILGSGWATRLEIVRPGTALEVFEPFAQGLQRGPADFLISNPPYLVRDDGIEAEVLAHEPAPALFAPPEDPLHFYRRIALQGPGHLRAGGRVYCELPHERAGEILKLFENSGWNARILRDLAGRERVLAGSFGKALGQNG